MARKMIRKNEILIYELLNNKNYFVNYDDLIKEKVNELINKNEKVYLNFDDVLFSKIVINQIEQHIKENSNFIKCVTILNNMPLLAIMNNYLKKD